MELIAYFSHIFVLAGIWTIMAVSLNLAMGYTGLLNIGHIAFYGIGAYVSAILTLSLGFNFWFGILCGGLVASLFGLLLAIPSIKLRGDYLAIATLGFVVIMETIFKNWISLTKGPIGLAGISKPTIFGTTISGPSYLLLVFLFVLISYFIIYKIINSPFGRILKAIREDELAIKSLGKHTNRYKAIALAISAFFAGFAGSLYAHYTSFIDPSAFSIVESIMVVSMVVIGGLGTLFGPLVGVFILFFIIEMTRLLPIPSSILGALRQIIYSGLLILMLVLKPKGILGKQNGGKK